MRLLLAACLAALLGCASARSADVVPPAHAGGGAGGGDPARLWYVGLALFDETWSENDVTEVPGVLAEQASRFEVVPLVFSNHYADRPVHYPPADARSVGQAFESIAREAGPDDVVLVYASTHGAPGELGVSAAGQDLPSVGAEQLRRWLAPLGRRPTVLVLSACFSGSFIPKLQADNRVILTAARADRTSFGCQAGAQHTVFGAAFLDALHAPHASWRSIVARVRAEVSAAEVQLHVTQPSQPQVSVGRAVTPLFDAPDF